MNVEVAIIDTSERGIQVALGDGTPFGLPRTAPGMVWSALPEIGDVVMVRLPSWLCAKHRQLQSLRYQCSLSFHQPPGLDPTKAQGPMPMANEYPPESGKGALYRNTKADKPSHPSHTGFCEIGGTRHRIAAWVRTNEKTGEKFFSLSFRDADEQRTNQVPKPAGGQSFADSEIPFAPEWR